MSGKQDGRAVNVTGTQRNQNGAVVPVGRRFPFGAPSGKQEACARNMQIVYRAQEPRHATGGKYQTVKCAIGLLPGLDVARLIARRCGVLRLIEYGLGKMRRRIAQGEYFEHSAHFRNLADLVQAETGDPDAAARLALHQSLRFETAKCFPHRHVACPEFLGNVILPQPGAGLDPA